MAAVKRLGDMLNEAGLIDDFQPVILGLCGKSLIIRRRRIQKGVWL